MDKQFSLHPLRFLHWRVSPPKRVAAATSAHRLGARRELGAGDRLGEDARRPVVGHGHEHGVRAHVPELHLGCFFENLRLD